MLGRRTLGQPSREELNGLASLLVATALVALVVAVRFLALSDGRPGTEPAAVAVQATPTPTVTATATPTSVPTPVPTPTPTPLPPPLAGNQHMVIERIGVDAPLAAYSLDANRIPIVPTGPDASYIVAWYDFSAQPGTGGNAVYAGHVTWNGPAVFYGLSVLGAGDLIRLRDERGAEVVYQVTTNIQIDPADPRSLDWMYPLNQDVITIITCAGSFFPVSGTVAGGDYTARTVIRADLVSITRV